VGASGPLPTGTVTLLLADVEASTRLWETESDSMSVAIAGLDGVVAACQGARPVEQGEGDSFVVAFARASDAIVCALELQRAQLAPIRLRIGVHTGEVQLRDERNYMGPTVNRAARLRDLTKSPSDPGDETSARHVTSIRRPPRCSSLGDRLTSVR